MKNNSLSLGCLVMTCVYAVCFPVTAMECPDLQAINNGDMDMTNLSVDSSISFQCNPGFSLVGERSLRCGSDAAWTTQPPLCERKWALEVSDLIISSLLISPHFVGWVNSSPIIVTWHAVSYSWIDCALFSDESVTIFSIFAVPMSYSLHRQHLHCLFPAVHVLLRLLE